MMILVGARSGATGLQAMGGSARARATHELRHVIDAGSKKNRAHVKENKVDDGRIPDQANGRPKGSYSAREPSEDLALLAR